jgi:hypothetical protein
MLMVLNYVHVCVELSSVSAAAAFPRSVLSDGDLGKPEHNGQPADTESITRLGRREGERAAHRNQHE